MHLEISHLYSKIKRRDREKLENLDTVDAPQPHPCFLVVPGPVAPWERMAM